MLLGNTITTKPALKEIFLNHNDKYNEKADISDGFTNMRCIVVNETFVKEISN